MTLPEETGRNREHKLQAVATAPVFYPTTSLEFHQKAEGVNLEVLETQGLMKRSLNSPKNFSRDGSTVEITFSILASLIIVEYLNSCIIRD